MSARRAAAAAAIALIGAASRCFAEPFQDALLRDHLWNQVLAMPDRPKTGVVLSAGGVRGFGHVGVLAVLEDAGFPLDVIAGTSMGAVVGALYAGGVPLRDFWKVADPIKLALGPDIGAISVLDLILRERLLSTESLEKFLKEKIGDKQFHQLSRKFACVAMDIKTGEAIVFREGPVAPAVRASMNLPGLFAPVEYRHRYLVDGGVVDYIPVDVAKLLGAEWVIASVTEGDYTKSAPTNVLSSLEQVIDIRGALLSRDQRRQAQVVIEPEVGDISFYQRARSREAMDRGVIAAEKGLAGAKESLILFSIPRLWKKWSAR